MGVARGPIQWIVVFQNQYVVNYADWIYTTEMESNKQK